MIQFLRHVYEEGWLRAVCLVWEGSLGSPPTQSDEVRFHRMARFVEFVGETALDMHLVPSMRFCRLLGRNDVSTAQLGSVLLSVGCVSLLVVSPFCFQELEFISCHKELALLDLFGTLFVSSVLCAMCV